jgi:hypothetical protein
VAEVKTVQSTTKKNEPGSMEKKKCLQCNLDQGEANFTKNQWKKADNQGRKCTKCTNNSGPTTKGKYQL